MDWRHATTTQVIDSDEESDMFHGITNINLTSTDVPAAAQWYSEVLDLQPYFTMPPTGPAQYVEFRFGPDEDELGIMDATFRPGERGLGGPLVYLQVDDVAAAVERLVGLGATAQDPLVDRGHGFTTASVVDPFGNLIGLMHSPHWQGQHD